MGISNPNHKSGADFIGNEYIGTGDISETDLTPDVEGFLLLSSGDAILLSSGDKIIIS